MKAVPSGRNEYYKRKQTALYRKQMRLVGALRHKRLNERFLGRCVSVTAKIVAPQHFHLTSREHRDVLLDFIEAVTNNLRNGKNVVLDFRQTTELHPCGTLYFVANIEVLIEIFPGRLTCKLPKNDVVEQLFQHIGFLEKLGQTSGRPITATNVVKWHYATGIDATTSAFASLLTDHGDALGGLIARSELYDSMSEAVINARKHAYPLYNDDESRWWMFSQTDNGVLTVVICDLGIGIPESLMHKPQLKDLVRKLLLTGSPQKLDKRLLQIATNTARTSSELPYRGKGLPQMLNFIKKGDKGGFGLQSGYGYYSFDAVRQRERTGTYRRSITGTIILWTLSLQT